MALTAGQQEAINEAAAPIALGGDEEAIDLDALTGEDDGDNEPATTTTGTASARWQDRAAALPPERRLSQTAEQRAAGIYVPNRYDLAFDSVLFSANNAGSRYDDKNSNSVSQRALHVLGMLSVAPGMVVKGQIYLRATSSEAGSRLTFSWLGNRNQAGFEPATAPARNEMESFKAGVERAAVVYLNEHPEVVEIIRKRGQGNGQAVGISLKA